MKRLIFFVFIILAIPSSVFGAEIASDNFDSVESWVCADGKYGIWDHRAFGAPYDDSCTNGCDCGGAGNDEVSEITAPGRGGSGKSFKHRRCGSCSIDSYAGYLTYAPCGDVSEILKVYWRFYLKIPSGFNYDTSENCVKFHRVTVNTFCDIDCVSSGHDEIPRFVWCRDGGGPTEAFLKGYFDLGSQFVGFSAAYREFSGGRIYLEDMNDGEWHSWEYMLDIQPTQAIVQLWIDGVSKGTMTVNYTSHSENLTITCLGGDVVTYIHSGNTWNGNWTFELDDYVVSTTYIGPESETPSVSVTATDASATEDGGTGTYRITRSNSTGALNCTISMGGTATNGTDYQTISSPQTIADGNIYVDVTLTPIEDGKYEGGSETAIFNLNSCPGYTITTSSATVNIADKVNVASPISGVGIISNKATMHGGD